MKRPYAVMRVVVDDLYIDDEAAIRAVLAEIGFWCVIDSMCEQIRLAEGT